MTDPITNADQAIDAAVKVVEQAYTGPHGYQYLPSVTRGVLAASIRSLKDRVASPADGAAEARAQALAEAAKVVLLFRPTGENAKHFIDVLVCDIADAVRRGKRDV